MTGSNAGGRSRNAGEAYADSISAALAASRALVGVASRSLTAVEGTITLVQFRALVLLVSRGDLLVGNLADALDVHQTTATRLCDRLVAKGLVDRTSSAESRREVIITVTAQGRALVRAVSAKRRREINTILARLSTTKRAAIASAFWTFAESAGEARDDAWRLGWTE